MLVNLTRSQMFLGALAGTGLVAAGFGMSAARAQPTKPATARAAIVQDEGDEAGEGEESIDPSKLPAAVQATARKTFGTLAGLKASREEDEGSVLYEVEGKVDGRQISIKCVDNGLVYELERAISAAELPPGATDNLQKMFQGAKLVATNSVEVHYFEAVLEVNGKRHEVAVGVSGRVHTEKDEEDEEHEGGNGR